MTLDEAIEHCEEKAEELERSAKLHQRPDRGIKGSGKRYLSCIKCASEHRQLAEWLRELKAYRIATYKLSRMPYEDGFKYDADEVWDLFYKLWTAEVELEVMQYAEVNADGAEENS